ncbi:MAG TPA: glycoside hydrolase family 97 protein [Terrimicrobiaceae bacterium]
MGKQVLILSFLLFSFDASAQQIQSPDGRLSLSFALTENGAPAYELSFGGKSVIKNSKLGIELKDQPSFFDGFTIVKADTSQKDESWEPVWGEVKQIRNHYRELAVTLEQKSINNRKLIIRFRLFNDGLGFRYEFPEQDGLKYFIISDEKTQFNLTGDHKTFWIPGDYDSNEYAYSTTKLSEVDATKGESFKDIAAKSLIGPDAVQTPLMMKTADGLYINIHEAALIDYPAMNVTVNKETFALSSHLVPDALGNKAYMQAPCKTPWRTAIISDKAVDILASKLILNLNEPTKLQDASWIKPQKYIGIWWGMHIGKYTWNYATGVSVKLDEVDWTKLKPNGRHGATTENTKRYIDFAARHGFDGVLVEGWNVGWEDWFGRWKEEVFDFVTPYPDFDIVELQNYAAAKGVKLIMHHETSSSVTNYERRMDEAFRFMKQHGYDTVKTGYVGKIIPRGEHHDGQWMVGHYVRVAEKTARHKIMLNAHEPVRPTGLQRTYPNWLASEAARGNEFNSGWSETGNPPEHETILPFTRLMGGPMDYTPGIFQIRFEEYSPRKKGQMRRTVQTTLAKQLALYVTMYSPLQMAADLPEHYEKFMDAFQFIKEVAVDWDDTRILEAEPGDYLTIARKAKNRDEWYIGAITDEQSRSSNIALSYLTPKRWYVATAYMDAPDADWKSNPMAYRIQSFLVNDQTILKTNLAPGGGAAISLKPASDEDMKKWKPYSESR